MASSRSPPTTYDVFLSFRGKETRKNFTDHLYKALTDSGILTFRDENDIQRGNAVFTSIKKAIEESKMAIIVFSEHYASSRWCLDELAMIMKRKGSDKGFVVIPVFYNLEPSDVRKKSGVFEGRVILEREKTFGDEVVRRWRSAIAKAADLGGFVLRDGYEAQFVQKIVEKVRELIPPPLHVCSYPVAIDARMERINSWLQDGCDAGGLAVVYGIGGVGKTTVAKAAYNQNCHRFEGSSFVANVREIAEKRNGIVRLQKQLVSDIVKGSRYRISNEHEGTSVIRKVVSCRRVLIVLDDVEQSELFFAIIGMQSWLCKGSKVIVTTRNENLLETHKVFVKFKIEPLEYFESLRLFSSYAFRRPHPAEGFKDYAKAVVTRCGGIPLALQILGSSLCGKSAGEWRSALQEMEAIPDKRIQRVLKLSYDSLSNTLHQEFFLDIACFFIGMEKDYVATILSGYGVDAEFGIQNLVERCLIAIDEENKITMHQLIRDMGRDIVRQESPDDPGKRSRLWHHNEVYSMLREESGTERVKGLSLTLHKMDGNGIPIQSEDLADDSKTWKFAHREATNLKMDAFARMGKLKLLQLHYTQFDGNYKDFPKGLRWLSWHGFPLKYVPDNILLEKLVVLDLSHSSLINAWRGIKFLLELKILILSHSRSLVRTPDFTGLRNLERLILKDCTSLVEIHESIGYLQKLTVLNIRNCASLSRLPKEIAMLTSLVELNLSGCSKFTTPSGELGKMESSRWNNVISMVTDLSPFVSSPLSILSQLSSRRSLKSDAFSLTLFPSHLVNLILRDCNISDVAIPDELCCLPMLETLDLSRNPISTLPEGIQNLTNLQSLRLFGCRKLQSLPSPPERLKELEVANCDSLQRIGKVESSILSTLGCDKLIEVEDYFRLEPLSEADIDMINDVGLFHLEFVSNIKVKLFNSETCTTIVAPLQILHQDEDGEKFSIFIPGREVPIWYHRQRKRSSIMFVVEPNSTSKIMDLNLCVVYGLPQTANSGHHILFAEVRFLASGQTFSYHPAFCGVPEGDDKEMLWLTHWRFDNLESLDIVYIAFLTNDVEIKSCGYYLPDEELHIRPR